MGLDGGLYECVKWALRERNVKVSGKKVAEHREALLSTAKRLLQKRGFGGAGVVEISREAGLTQGALYSQFKSKDALTVEAYRRAIAEGEAAWRELCETAPDVLSAFLDAYLCEAQINDPHHGCAMPACVSDVARQDPEIGAVFAEGFRAKVERLQSALPRNLPPDTARRRVLALACAMVGTVAMARALATADPDLAREVIAAAREELEQLAVRG